jgi:hypothetical protein
MDRRKRCATARSTDNRKLLNYFFMPPRPSVPKLITCAACDCKIGTYPHGDGLNPDSAVPADAMSEEQTFRSDNGSLPLSEHRSSVVQATPCPTTSRHQRAKSFDART